jgi:hypothetical protein
MSHSITDARSTRPDAVSHAVVDAVARANDVDARSLPPLYDVVDPDALETLIGGSSAIDCVRFVLAGCEVVVRGDGTVDATAVDESPVTVSTGTDASETALD